MAVPRVKTCCCCFDLKTGNTILGGLNAFFSFVTFVVFIMVCVDVQRLMVEMDLIELVTEDKELKKKISEVHQLYALSIILVLMFLAKFLFDLIFVYGVVTGRARIIRIYYITLMVFFALATFVFCINFFYYPVATLLWYFFYAGEHIYIIIVCYSYYKELTEEHEEI